MENPNKSLTRQNTYVHLPTWFAAILLTASLTVIGYLFNNINNRLDRLETKLDNYIMLHYDHLDSSLNGH
jgi:hypothetical protein